MTKIYWCELEVWNWIYDKKQWIDSWEWNKKRDWTIIVKIQEWKQYSWTLKTAKQANELHQFVLNLSQRLNLRKSDKHVALLRGKIWENSIKTIN